MRIATLVAALLLAGCTGSPDPQPGPVAQEPQPPPPAPAAEVTLLDQGFLAGPGLASAYTVEVEEPLAASVLRIVRNDGVVASVRVTAPGACDGTWDAGVHLHVQAGSAIERACGPLEPGRHTVQVHTDGYLQGRLVLTGR